MTDGAGEAEARHFYDDVASFYDEMTDFTLRWERERPAIEHLVRTMNIRTAVDAGSGTGFHSLLMATLGVDVVAVDCSGEMLSRLQSRAAEMKLRIRTVQAAFRELRREVLPGFDAVFCMGNSLSHLRSLEELTESLSAFRRILRPGGILVAHVLNYAKILSSQERIQSIREVSGTLYVRFYDFSDPYIQFNILSLWKEQTGYHSRLHSIQLRPLLSGQVVDAVRAAGFGDIGLYGGIALDEFRPDVSRDCLCIARLPGRSLSE